MIIYDVKERLNRFNLLKSIVLTGFPQFCPYMHNDAFYNLDHDESLMIEMTFRVHRFSARLIFYIYVSWGVREGDIKKLNHEGHEVSK